MCVCVHTFLNMMRLMSDLCIRCGQEKGTFFIVFGNAIKFNRVWREIKRALENILGVHLTLDPKVFILGLHPDEHYTPTRVIVALDLFIAFKKSYIHQTTFCGKVKHSHYSGYSFNKLSPVFLLIVDHFVFIIYN